MKTAHVFEDEDGDWAWTDPTANPTKGRQSAISKNGGGGFDSRDEAVLDASSKGYAVEEFTPPVYRTHRPARMGPKP